MPNHRILKTSPQGTVTRAGQLSAFLLLGGALLTGCATQRELMPSPNVYQGAGAPELFVDLPEALKSNEIDLLFVTDRAPEQDADGNLAYDYQRSRSAAFGSAIVTIEPDLPWDTLAASSLAPDRNQRLTLELESIREIARFPATPPAMVLVDGIPQEDPDSLALGQATQDAFRKEIQRRIDLVAKPEVVLYVHGFNNDFDDAAFTLAELWHFLGREHVPILYTWPAGRGGASGYIYDRESGEFTILHLKNVLRSLLQISEIEKLHLIAHSRGTDVLTSAIREIKLETQGEQGQIPEVLAGSDLMLAAPDLDWGVVEQRLIGERIGRGLRRVTIYTSAEDRAISMAETFFKSVQRLGRLTPDALSENERMSMALTDGLSIVEFAGKADKTGHGYFHTSPAASSDLILEIRYDRSPGAEDGRPLIPVAPGFWRIEEGYPNLPAPNGD